MCWRAASALRPIFLMHLPEEAAGANCPHRNAERRGGSVLTEGQKPSNGKVSPPKQPPWMEYESLTELRLLTGLGQKQTPLNG